MKALALLSLAAAATALVACGSSSDPKRAVDARTEVIRFFDVEAPLVAIVGGDPGAELARLRRSLEGNAGALFSGAVEDRLEEAGIGVDDLGPLAEPDPEIEGVSSFAVAAGLSGTAEKPSELVVLATDQDEALEAILRRSGLRPDGELDEALLYSGRSGAFAVRDGVLVAAASPAQARAAIRRRDGDSDEQLDEGVVNDLLNDLRSEGAIDLYLNVPRLLEADPSLRAAAGDADWLAALGKGAMTAGADGSSVQIEVEAEVQDASAAQLPVGDAPQDFTVSAEEVAAVLPGEASADAVQATGLAPLSGTASASGDEIRAQAEASR